MNAESAKAYAEANKIKGVDTDATKQGIKESGARIDEIIAKIPLVVLQWLLACPSLSSLQCSFLHSLLF